MRHLLLSLLVLGCSGGGTSESTTRPLVCDPADRVGTYWTVNTTLSGNCGEIPAQLVRTTEDVVEGCTIDAPDTWSDNGCTLERSFSCVLEDGTRFSAVGITHQEDMAGDVITGTMSVTMSNTTGTPICAGSYSVHYVRQ